MATLIVPRWDSYEPWPTLGPQVCDLIEERMVFGPGSLGGEPAKLHDDWRGVIYALYEVYPKGHKWAGRRRFDRDFRLELQRIFGDELLQTHIRPSVRIIEAAAQGVSVVEQNTDYPVAEDFKWLSREILGLPLEREQSDGPVNGNRLHEDDVVFETMVANSPLYY